VSIKKLRFFYGYWIAAAAFLLSFVQAGFGLYAFSLFVIPLQSDLGWSRGEIMAAFTSYYVVFGGTSPYVGRLVDRYGVRKIIFAGALIVGLGFLGLSLMNSLWQFHMGYVIVGVGMAAISHVPATTVISNWFKKRRGMAIGIMSAGIGAGGLVMAPLIGGYIIPNFGWSTTYLVLSISTLVVVIPLALWVIRTKPAVMGLYPDGIAAPVEPLIEAPAPFSKGLTLRMALVTPTFWLIFISFLAMGVSANGVIQTQVPYLGDIGFPVGITATALGGLGLVSAIGKILFGLLCDRVPAKYAGAIGLGFGLAGVITLMNVEVTSPIAILWLYVITMGLASGSWLPTLSMITSTNFGLASYGAIFGLIIFGNCFGTAIGPLIAGYLFDTTNSYHGAFIIFLALYAVSIPSILAVRRPKFF